MKKLGLFIFVILSILLVSPGMAGDGSGIPEQSLFVGDTAVSINYLIYHPAEGQAEINALVSRQGLTMKDLWYRILDGSVLNVYSNEEATAEDLETIESQLLFWIDENGVSHPIVTYIVTFNVNVDDAVVTFDGVEYEAGVYIIEGIKAGTYNYSVSKVGYTTFSGSVDVQSDIVVDVILEEKAVAIGSIQVGAMTFNNLKIDEVYAVSGAAKFSVDKVETIKGIGSGDVVTFMGSGTGTLQIYDDQEVLLATGNFQIPVSLGEHDLSVDLEIVSHDRYTLDMSILGQGTVIPDVGSYEYNEGTIVDISAVPDDDWKFTEWQLNGEFYSDDAETTITMDANKSVTAVFEWDGGVTKATGTITVGAMTFNEVLVNEVEGVEGAVYFGIYGIGGHKEIGGDVPLTFQGAGSTILEIYDSEDTLLATGILAIPASLGEHPFTVGLEIVQPGERYTLEMSMTGQGTVIPDVGSYEYNEGTIVDISAVPDTDWKFTEWQLNGEFYSDDTETTITMNADKSVTAVFEWDGGATKATGTIKVGAMTFNEVLVNEVEGVEGATYFGIYGIGGHKQIDGDTPISFTGTGSVTLEIYDSEDTLLATGILAIPASLGEHPFIVGLEIVQPGERYTLEMSMTGQGTITPDVGSYEYNDGTIVSLSAVPDADWKFGEWLLNGEFYSDDAETTITMDADKSVTAVFEWDGGATKATGTIKVGAMAFNEVLVNEVEGVEGATYFGVYGIGDHKEIAGDTPISFTGSGSAILEIYDSEDTLLATGILTIPVSQGEHSFTVGLEIVQPGERYTLEISMTGQGTVVPEVGVHQYDEGTVVDISAVPDNDWLFTEWQLNGEFYSDDAETTVTMDADKNLNAVFTLKTGVRKAVGTINVGTFGFNELLVSDVSYVDDAKYFSVTDAEGSKEIGGDETLSFTGTGSTVLQIYDDQEVLLATGTLSIPASLGEHEFEVKLELSP